MKNKLKLIHAVVLAVALAGVSAQAVDRFWDGDAADGVWTNALNWDLDVAPSNSADRVYLDIADTANYQDGYTNNYNRMRLRGGMILNVTGGDLRCQQSGNTVRDFIGGVSGHSYLNQSGGFYNCAHVLRIGDGAAGTVNLSGGFMDVSRGGNGITGNGGTSVQIGSLGTLNITNGTFETRTGVEIQADGVFHVHGGGSSITLGASANSASDGDWFQTSNAVLKVGISTDGLTPIVLEDNGEAGTPTAVLFPGAILDVSFVDGAMEDNSWPVIVNTNGTISNLGMVFAAGVDTNDWGFITSNNTLYVGHGLGWPAGGDVKGPPAPGRDLFWTGAAGTTDADNGTNWVVGLEGTETDWGPYNDDNWNIGNINFTAGEQSVVDYDGTSTYPNQGSFSVGNQTHGQLNFNVGTHSFATTTSSRQYIGHGSTDGDGTVNLNNGTLEFNSLSVGNNGASGAINVYGGTLTVGRASNIGTISASIALAESGAGGTGTVHIAGGRMFTRTGVSLGAGGPSSVGIFSVEGSTITDIGIGANSALDGAWYQSESSILKIRLDEGGITPIRVLNKDAALGGNDGNVYFMTGSTLDIDWLLGVTNYNSFDVMTWDGQLVDSNLTLAASVDTSIWSFEFVDTNADTTNDTLRATAYGETDRGTPFGWLNEYNLTGDEEDDDTDGLLTWEEYIAGTIPTDSNSVLVVNSLTSFDGNAVISWQSVAGKTYSIIANPDLVNGTPTEVGSDIVGLATETSVTSAIPAASSLFYQIGVE